MFLLFFSIAAILRVQSARRMWLSSTLPLCCRRVWCVTGLLLATHFVLLSFGSTFSAVWSSRPQLQAGDGASFISLYMWAMIRLCLIRILMAACYQRSRKWKSSLLVHCPLRTTLMRVLCSWMATLVVSLPSISSRFGESFVLSFPGRPQWAGTHCRPARLCCAAS